MLVEINFPDRLHQRLQSIRLTRRMTHYEKPKG
jgi:5-methylcytosine-specific restriction endonuclease McrBC regulatory subunit McrC